jgi:hypothetical protein
MPTAKNYTVLVEWEDQGVCDADEIVVRAVTKRQATSIARQRWWKTNSAAWPSCRIRAVRTIRENGRLLIDSDRFFPHEAD